MPTRKVIATRDEDISSEDDLVSASSRAVPKKSNKKKVTDTKTATKRKAPAKQIRPALQDRTNVHNGTEINETAIASDDEDNISHSKTKRARVDDVVKKAVHKDTAKKTSETKKYGRVAPKKDEIIPETQQEVVQIGKVAKSFVTDSMESRVEPRRPHIKSRTPAVQSSQEIQDDSTRNHYKQSQDVLQDELNAVRAECDRLRSQRGKDELRALDDARANFDRLKDAADRKSAQADALVSSLKKEIETLRNSLRSSSSNSKETQSRIDSEQTRFQELLNENKRLEKEFTALQGARENQSSMRADYDKLTEELSTIQEQYKSCEFDKKALEAKLAAARQQLVKSAKSPRSQSARVTGINTTEAQREATKKENLYTDLTGLIIRGVRQKNGEDEFDCIQTGRNGTLHFHLTVLNDTDNNPKTTGGQSYEDVEFAYEPFLDESRDKDLLELLPEYLAEEICFPRNHAVKFYTKVVESMTKKVTVED